MPILDNFKFSDDDQECKIEKNWEVVERLLFVYAKLNQGTKYIQGMNEIIGPIYFVLSQDPDLKWSRHAEADTFYCFTQGKEISIIKFLRRKWSISCFANLLSWPIL